MLRRVLLAAGLLAAAAPHARAHGVLLPDDKALPPLAMVHHRVSATVEDQVAVTDVEQTFRNHTPRPLEATYLFPVPRGASVNKFTMWVDGKEVAGEMVPADKARQIYTGIVRRTLDPGLLEYAGHDLLRMRVFPVPPRGDQKVAVRFTAVCPQDAGLVEYTYPLRAGGTAFRTLEDFSVRVTVKSQHPVLSVYSPTHAVTQTRAGEREVRVSFDRPKADLDRDFQLYYSVGDQDVGVTPLAFRPISAEDGYVMLLVAPRADAARPLDVPQDVVFVLDVSGSMAGVKMEQAKKALQACLGQLGPKDRFAVVAFSTTVTRFRDKLVACSPEYLDAGRAWIDGLRPSGGTAIADALAAAQELRPGEAGRTFAVVFLTDGQPTVGETNPDRIVKSVEGRATAETRVFTFGVGDDVNAHMLDRIAEGTRAASTYVRPAEDIEVKASALYAKVSRPALTDVRLTVGDNVRLEEVYPPRLPDLFHGGQLLVLGRYSGDGPTAVRLSGRVGAERREFAYDVTFPKRTDGGRDFVEHLWARRKVGYLLDQVRQNGESKEVVEEIVKLATKYGIATPYTSYLVVPDGVPQVPPPGVRPLAALGGRPLGDFAREAAAAPGGPAARRDGIEDEKLQQNRAKGDADARGLKESLRRAGELFRRNEGKDARAGKLGVDLAVAAGALKAGDRLAATAVRPALGRRLLEVGGAWIDDGFKAGTPVLAVKAQSDAYFRILDRQPRVAEVLRLGNHVVWVSPSGTALVIDAGGGKESLTDAEIDALFRGR